jgi:hypothetical protein
MKMPRVWSSAVWALLLIACSLLCVVHGFEGAFNANHELLLAARNGDAGRVKHMIDSGAYLEARNNNGVR